MPKNQVTSGKQKIAWVSKHMQIINKIIDEYLDMSLSRQSTWKQRQLIWCKP